MLRKQGIWTLRGEKSTSQNAYSVLRYPKFLCNIHFERYAICLYNFPLTDFVNPNVYAIWGVMHYESDAKREVWLYYIMSYLNLRKKYEDLRKKHAKQHLEQFSYYTHSSVCYVTCSQQQDLRVLCYNPCHLRKVHVVHFCTLFKEFSCTHSNLR